MGHMRVRRVIVTALCAALVLLALSAAAPAVGPPPPVNDDYLFSLELNSRGHPLNSTDTLKDVRNTAAATVQSNIFNPPHPEISGPAEVTNCGGTSYGKTVWYDFYPNANGIARIRASGFDNVITLYPFNVSTALPDVAHKRCVHQSSFPSEELDAPVSKGKAY